MADDKLNRRLDALEQVEAESEVEQLTVRIAYTETYFNEHGERCERQLPATYDESVETTPFPPARYNSAKGRWTTMRVLHPLEPEQQQMRGPYDPPSVPKTLSADAEKDADAKG